MPLPGLLDAAKSAVLAELHRRLAEAGHTEIRDAHGCVFRFVRDDGMRLTELAELARITKQSAGEIVDHLERLGYVERVPDPSDGRAKLLRLTARGHEVQSFAFGLFQEIEARWAEQLGAENVAVMRETLEGIVAGELGEPARPLAA
jgi:DNA-binding MarR family transcriptional regulator